MKKIFLLLFVFSLFTSVLMAGKPEKIQYVSYKHYLEALKKRCEVSMLSEDSCTKLLAMAPVGGAITVHFKDFDEGQANSKSYYYIVEFDGKEIYRREGKDVAPVKRTVSGSASVYYEGKDLVILNTECSGIIKFHVVDNKYNKRYSYQIDTTTGKITSLKAN